MLAAIAYVFAYALVLAPSLATVAAVDHFIDDQSGDSATGTSVTYFPADGWSQGVGCNACSIRPDASEAQGGTWHDTTYSVGDSNRRWLEVTFTGTSVQVFNILYDRIIPDQVTATNLQFFLDGEEDVSRAFSHSPSGEDAFEYNARVYSRSGLDNTQHTLRVQADTDTGSLILFDYIQYTVPDSLPAPPPPSSSSTPTTPSPTTSPTSNVTVRSSANSAGTETRLTTVTETQSATFTETQTRSTPSTLDHGTTSPIIHASSLAANSSLSSSSESQTQTTTAVPASSTSSSPTAAAAPVGLIAGVTGGGVGILLLIVIAVSVVRRRARSTPEVVPYMEKPTTDDFDSGAEPAHPSSARSNVGLIGKTGRSPISPFTSHSPAPNPIDASDIYGSDSSYDVPVHTISIISETARPNPHDPTDLETAVASSYSPLMQPDQKPAASPTSPFTRAFGRWFRPLPQLPGEDVAVRPRNSRTVVSNGRSMGAAGSNLHAQVAALQEEVARIREQQEMFVETPPRYDQV
ncbi:hypothetical protein C8Q76DRAFT_727901 [Earliella scabrosa]|nr:hypothetical protein C8Q76DRAFT_727901 [Earliella scabrosa]